MRKQQFSACCEKEKEVILVIATQPQPIPSSPHPRRDSDRFRDPHRAPRAQHARVCVNLSFVHTHTQRLENYSLFSAHAR
jgi:hypothetical protein